MRDDREVERRLEAMLAEHGGALRAAISRSCPAGVSQDDVAQDARVRLWNAIKSEREITNGASYVYRVAVTATLDAVRRMKARREESLEIETRDGERSMELPAGAGSDPERQTSRKLLEEKIGRAMARLQPNRRQAVSLHLQGFTSDEVAGLAGWTEAKARNLIYRGLEDLRSELREAGIHG